MTSQSDLNLSKSHQVGKNTMNFRPSSSSVNIATAACLFIAIATRSLPSVLASSSTPSSDFNLSHTMKLTSPLGQGIMIAQSPKQKKPDSALKAFLSGGVGGTCAVLVGHPFDLIKVRIQTAGSAEQSVLKMLRETFAKDGIRGLYRGVSAPILATAPIFSVSFWGYDMGKRFVQACDREYTGDVGGYRFTIPQLCAAGALSALPTTAIMAPSERLKCLLQIHPGKYNGLADCARKVYSEGGIQSIFRGTGATLMRDVPGSFAYFGAYEIVKKSLMKLQKIDPESGALSPFAILCAGGIAGMACWAVSIPADVLKSRFQTAPEGKYNGIMEVYRQLMKEEGSSALFRGMRPALIRAFPANAACFFGVEIAKSTLAFLD